MLSLTLAPLEVTSMLKFIVNLIVSPFEYTPKRVLTGCDFMHEIEKHARIQAWYAASHDEPVLDQAGSASCPRHIS